MGSMIDRTAYASNLERVGLRMRSTVDRILRAYDKATEADRAAGERWYNVAHDLAEELSGSLGSVEHAACVISHLSPRTSWKRNARAARDLAAGVNPSYAIGANVKRARGCLNEQDPYVTLGGLKTQAFARNILGCEESVTVDVWAARVAVGSRYADAEALLRLAGVYEAIAQAYRIAARRRGVTPRTMQATCWVVVRGGRAD